jgi:ATP-binding protein involved in chromosome partitioning
MRQTRLVSMDLPEEPAPISVDLDRTSGLTVRWADGTETGFGLEELRVNCPCAECRGRREQGHPAWPGPGAPQPLEATGAELVGAWGISLRWNDRHETGIYAWGLLRHWSDDPAKE